MQRSPLDSISPGALADLCRRHEVQELALFGSAGTDRFRPASDLDFLVTFQPQARPGFLTLTRLQRDLEALFHRKVDLVPKKGLKPAIRDSVLAEARVVYAD
jgi:predicted nucleotidyltransferase